MKPGGGHAKGSSFERKTGALLSLWLTKNARADLFSRNVLSGGRFTNAAKDGKNLGIPGDLIAAHPLAFEFLAIFSVECKHRATLHLDQLFFMPFERSYIGGVFKHTADQAKLVGLRPFIVAKQNNQPALVFVPSMVALTAALFARRRFSLSYHTLNDRSMQTVACMQLASLLTIVSPGPFLQSLRGNPPDGKLN